ncbi:MAG: VWA domain-containing protein [Promethearchaeota archaeon]|nr:MAG: VWA domain-containing protein [Candidatus Lokiarchaeota archaeon]
MLRTDFTPNRLHVAFQVAINFIQSKFIIDPKDRISLVSFGEDSKKLTHFSYDEDVLIDNLKKIQITGKGVIHEAIALSLQIIVEEMRKLGGKVFRIFIISDNKVKSDPERLEKILEVSRGLGIFIDTCQLGKPLEKSENMLKYISQLTNGEYGYFSNEKAVINSGKSYASKKIIQHTPDFYSSQIKEKTSPLVSEIALSLRRPTMMEIRLMMRNGGREQEKCQICHSIKAPTGADFYSEGRFCPNCDRPMHLSCASMWAAKSELKEDIFRCPFCYFLLKLPKSASKLVKKKDEKKDKISIIEESDEKKTKMIEIDQIYINQINESCVYCHNIFLGKYKVYKCQKCGSYYHEPCLKKTYEELKSCRFCGAEIIS